MPKTEPEGVVIIAYGVLTMGACAPKTATKEEIERVVNEQHEAGTTLGWVISNGETLPFSDEPNLCPCPCDEYEDRLHYLLNC